MEAEKFIQLPLDKKLSYLWDHGECVHQRTIRNGHTLCLFSLDDFFVETVYSKQNNEVLSIRFMEEFLTWSAYVERVINQQFNIN